MTGLAMAAGAAAAAAAWFGLAFFWISIDRRRFHAVLGQPKPPFWSSRRFQNAVALMVGGLGAGFIMEGKLWASAVGAIAAFLALQGIRTEKNARFRREWEKDLPEFLDFVGLALSSGLPFPDAVRKATVALPAGVLKRGLSEMVGTVNRIRSVHDAIRRINILDPDHAALWSVMTTGVEKGIPLQEFVFSQSETIRQKRMQALERRAQTVGIRLLFPILFFIFPSFFIALFGPILLYAAQNGGFF